MNNKKRMLLGSLIIVVLSITLVSAGFWDLFKIGDKGEDLEGELPAEKPAQARVTIQNEPPVVIEVSGIRDINRVTPPILNELDLTGATPDETTDISFDFIAYDPNGQQDIDETSAEAYFNNSGNGPGGQQVRDSDACVEATGSPFTAGAGDFGGQYTGKQVRNFTCTIQMHFFDTPYSTWQINASIMDGANRAENYSVYFTVEQINSFQMSPTQLVWSGVPTSIQSGTGINADAGTHPIELNNTGNMNFASTYTSRLKILGLDLVGNGENSEQLIYAEYFSVNAQASLPASGTCATLGTQRATLVNYTVGAVVQSPQDITAFASLPRGNSSKGVGEGQEYLFFCIENINSGLSGEQDYTTAAAGGPSAWQIVTGS